MRFCWKTENFILSAQICLKVFRLIHLRKRVPTLYVSDHKQRSKTPFHWTAIPLRSWRSRIFFKIIPNHRRSVEGSWHFQYASTTLPLRCCCDPTTTMKIWLRLVYADGDVAATLLRTWRWSYAFVALLYPFYIESEILVRFYYDLGASTALLLRSCRFCYDSCHFDQNFES